MLSKKMQEALNAQIAQEAEAANTYLAMASWCDKKGLRGSASFLYTHSEQERAHMMKLFRYTNDAGGHAFAPSVKQPEMEYASLGKIFEILMGHERKVTESINRLVDVCLNEKDYSTFNFLQWYVAEQHEEERLLTQVIEIIRITGDEGRGLFLVDKEIGTFAGK